MKPFTPPGRRAVVLGVAIAWALFVFDLVLGTIATLFPDGYLWLLHPHLETPQVELIRRTGILWLSFSAVAFIAATRRADARGRADARARWLLVLAWLRLMEVPADILYGLAASGASPLSRVLILMAPPINLGVGLYLFWLARALRRADAITQ